MTGRRPSDDTELIERLAELSGELAWPATPDLVGRVTAALEASTARPGTTTGVLARLRESLGAVGGASRRRRVARRSLVIALVALLAIVVVVAAIGLGVPGVRIELRPIATPPPSASRPPSSIATGGAAPRARATPPGQELGPTVSLDQARSDAGFGLLVPTASGYTDPAEIHLTGVQPFNRVTLRYPDQTLLTEFLGKIQPDAFQKIVGGETTVAPARVGTSGGWWIAGAPHQLGLLYRDPDGQTRWQEVTVTGNVLLWQVGDVTLRLETPLDREAAIAIATSLR
jgi:hypothetical protein